MKMKTASYVEVGLTSRCEPVL